LRFEGGVLAIDALIAATARVRQLSVVTRKVVDFQPSVYAINPRHEDRGGRASAQRIVTLAARGLFPGAATAAGNKIPGFLW
jgi:hypothetical protein